MTIGEREYNGYMRKTGDCKAGIGFLVKQFTYLPKRRTTIKKDKLLQARIRVYGFEAVTAFSLTIKEL